MNLCDVLAAGGDYLVITIDTEALTVTLSGTAEERQLAAFDTWDDLCAAYPATWQGLLDEHEDLKEALSWEDEDPKPLDLRAELERQQRRQRARQGADLSEWQATLDRVQHVVRSFDDEQGSLKRMPKGMRDEVDLSPAGLWSSLEPVIEIRRRRGAIPLGASKHAGQPHLPPDMQWPTLGGKPTYLLVQLNLAEVAKADLSGTIPDRGMLYVFTTETASGCVLTAASEGLVPRPYPFEVPSYMTRHVEAERRLVFRPGFFFRQTSDTYGPRAIAKALPDSFLRRVCGAFGEGVVEAGDAWGGDRIFGGDPIDWQAMGDSYLDNELFAQIEHGEGHVSVGVHPDDLRIACFDDADVGYCGT